MVDRYFIAPYDKGSGQKTNFKPWLIPDVAFAKLENCYVFRGRLRKRFGSRYISNDPLLSRLRVSIGSTDGSGNFTGSTPQNTTPLPIVPPAIGQLFSVGSQIFTVYQTGTPAAMFISGTATLATFNTTSGAVVINGAGATTTVYYYPALPVMGIETYETGFENSEIVIAFDTFFAYGYNNGWDRLSGETTVGSSVWAGNNANFFWTTTWGGANAFDKVLYVTNDNQNETLNMRTFFNNLWNQFKPQITVTPTYLLNAAILVVFKNRLVALNTWEGAAVTGDNYSNRARWCAIGSPLAADAWRQDIPGKGSGIDCPTTQAIISCEFVKDRLIVFFERSTWELVYTGSQIYPFAWQQINSELGAESINSIVPFDKVCFGVGNVGIMAANSTSVERIDGDIPQEVFDIHNADAGVQRVYGIRDYYVEMVYWSFPGIDANSSFPYPNRVLTYNYNTQTFAFNDDSITCFGYLQTPSTTGPATSWDSTTVTWDDDESWDAGQQQTFFRQVIAGNQEGFTFIIDSDEPTNAAVIQITNISFSTTTVTITAIDHNLRQGDYIYITGVIGSGTMSSLNGVIFQVAADLSTPNSFSIQTPTALSGTYKGGGLFSRVTNPYILTKEYNFYQEQGRNAYVSKVDFLVDSTSGGQFLLNYYVSTSQADIVQDSGATGTGSLIGTSILETYPYPNVIRERTATRLWHPLYFQADGESIQLEFTMNDAMMRSVAVWQSQFALHAMCIYAQPTSRLQ